MNCYLGFGYSLVIVNGQRSIVNGQFSWAAEYGSVNNNESMNEQKSTQHNIIGTSQRRVDAWGKVTGRAKFAEDYSVAHQLVGKPGAAAAQPDRRRAVEA